MNQPKDAPTVRAMFEEQDDRASRPRAPRSRSRALPIDDRCKLVKSFRCRAGTIEHLQLDGSVAVLRYVPDRTDRNPTRIILERSVLAGVVASLQGELERVTRTSAPVVEIRRTPHVQDLAAGRGGRS